MEMTRLLCAMLAICVGSAAIRLGAEPAGSQRRFTVTIHVTGAPFANDKTIAVIQDGIFKADMSHQNPKKLSAQLEGKKINVGVGMNYDACTYVVGQEKSTCFLQEWRIIFTSEPEVQETLQAMVLLTRIGGGNEPPVEIKVDGVSQWTENGPIQQQRTIWRMIHVPHAGVVLTLLFHSTNTECNYTTANTFHRQTTIIDGWTAEFETMVSTPYTGYWSEQSKKNANGWQVHLTFEGAGPEVEIYLNNEKMTTVGHQEYGTSKKIFDAAIGQVVRFVFPNIDNGKQYFFAVGDRKQFLENLDGYNIKMETIGNN